MAIVRQPKVQKPPALPEKKEPARPRAKTSEEACPDGELLLTIVIPGRPATKKTHQQIIYVKGQPKVIPNAIFKKYEKHCKKIMKEAWVDRGREPMNFGVSVRMRVWLDSWQVGDHCGYMQSLGDILEVHGVIADDMFIHWDSPLGEHWFGGKDKDNPRVSIEIRRLRHPYESFREEKEQAEAGRQVKREERDSRRSEK